MTRRTSGVRLNGSCIDQCSKTPGALPETLGRGEEVIDYLGYDLHSTRYFDKYCENLMFFRPP